jgi:hypothetical protein
MENARPAFVVYSPPVKGLPFLAVTLNSNGSATARRFETYEEAVAFNKDMSAASYDGGTKH